jgi:hypothetical protein
MFSVTGLSPSTAGRSKPVHLTQPFLTVARSGRTWNADPTTPPTQPLPGVTCEWFGLFRFRSPLLTESQLFSLPVGTEMFHFPTFPPHTLYIQVRVTPHHWCWVAPFGNPRITARLTAPRGISRPPTSFIGSWCQGIHRAPFKTYNTTNKDARVHYPVLKQHTTPQTSSAPAHDNTKTRRTGIPGKGRQESVFPQTPNSVSTLPHPTRTRWGSCQCSTLELPQHHTRVRERLDCSSAP